MQLRISSFLIYDDQQSDSKDIEKKNEKCSNGENGKFCYSLQHKSTFPFLILWGLLERIHIFLEHNCCAKGDKFQSQSFLMLCRHCKRWLKYILFTFQFTYVICKLHWAGPLCWICQFFNVSVDSICIPSVYPTKQVRFLSFAFFLVQSYQM